MVWFAASLSNVELGGALVGLLPWGKDLCFFAGRVELLKLTCLTCLDHHRQALGQTPKTLPTKLSIFLGFIR
jgi:hypothetical protein